MAYRNSVASFLHSKLFFSYRMRGFFFNARSIASTPSVVLAKLSWFQSSGEDEKIRVDRGIEQRSGLMTRKSAKYSMMDLTTSWSSASASRSNADFFMMLLKSVSVRSRPLYSCYAFQHTYVVFSILWFPELVDEELYAVG